LFLAGSFLERVIFGGGKGGSFMDKSRDRLALTDEDYVKDNKDREYKLEGIYLDNGFVEIKIKEAEE